MKWVLAIAFGICASFVVSAQRTASCCLNAPDFPALLDSLSARLSVRFSYKSGILPHTRHLEFCSDSTRWIHDLSAILGGEYELIQRHSLWVIRAVLDHPEWRWIRGSIKDAQTGLPLGFVHVGVVDERMGTVSNSAGEFLLKIPPYFSGKEASVSMVGYEPFRFRLSDSDSVLQIALFAASVRLPEIQIRYVKAQQVIDRFFQNHHRNYPQQSYWMDGFFRESLFNNGQLVQVSEAAVEVFKESYSLNAILEKVRFIKGRKSASPELLKQLIFKMEGGPFHFSRLDVARYFDFLPVTGQPIVYQYQFNGMDYAYGKVLYRIGFTPIDDNGDLKYEGELWFDVESYALIQADFQLTRKSLHQSGRALIRKTTGSLKARPLQAIYRVQYKPYEGKWWLSGVKGELGIRVKSKQNELDATMDAVSEWVVTQVRETEGERLKASESLKSDYVLYDQIADFDPVFWFEINVIQPVSPIEKRISE